ncbi:MAG: hypothetical protein MUE37_07345 [Bacteroidales bacterium]|jgi:hypothetical protein|nr:hypothetical protein [Bacteroidales bacterium]
MKIRFENLRMMLVAAILFAMVMPVVSQEVSVDLEVVYKIRQEGQRNSDIENLAYIMTDLAGPRLTGSQGLDRANEIARAKLAEYGFANVRIEEAGDFSRGGWDYSKAYAAMVLPYYNNFSVTPVAWTAGTDGIGQG